MKFRHPLPLSARNKNGGIFCVHWAGKKNIDFRILSQDSKAIIEIVRIEEENQVFSHAHVTLYEGPSVRRSVGPSVGPSRVFFNRGIQAKK